MASKLFSTTLLLALFIGAFARIGLADWECETPGGNKINNFVEYSIYLKNGTQLDWLHEWYFYKDCVIGSLHNSSPGGTDSYFVVNERSFQIDTFKTKEAWISFLRQNNLRPKLWTRWYVTDWKFFDSDLLFWAFIGFYITIPFLLLISFLVYKAIRKERFNFRKPYTIIVTILAVLLFLYWLFDLFPQSI